MTATWQELWDERARLQFQQDTEKMKRADKEIRESLEDVRTQLAELEKMFSELGRRIETVRRLCQEDIKNWGEPNERE